MKRSGKWNFHKKILCVKCKDRPAVNKRKVLCNRCYSRDYVSKSPYRNFLAENDVISAQKEHKLQDGCEIAFAQAHPTFRYEAVTFRLKDHKYTPDFYDASTNQFYEVIGSRQRLFQIKPKLQEFRSLFPFINLLVCYGDGIPIETGSLLRSEELPSMASDYQTA